MTLPPAPPKPLACRDSALLEPILREKARRIVVALAGRGVRGVIFETLRSLELARWYWQSGRAFEGPILTKKNPDAGGISRHLPNSRGLSEAFDILLVDREGNALPEADPANRRKLHPSWLRLGEEVRLAAGLTWGGDWNRNGKTDDERFRDLVHVELFRG